jgi:hypothetical protein
LDIVDTEDKYNDDIRIAIAERRTVRINQDTVYGAFSMELYSKVNN